MTLSTFDNRPHLFNIIKVDSSLFLILFLSDIEEISEFYASVDVPQTILLLILLLCFY